MNHWWLQPAPADWDYILSIFVASICLLRVVRLIGALTISQLSFQVYQFLAVVNHSDYNLTFLGIGVDSC